jgi:RNA polymerase sigma-70 factor, ECF subfamily
MVDLLRDARSGEPESMAAICGLFYPKVLKYMRYRADAASAEDLTGEVFLRVLRSIAGQKGSFVAWLYKIAANVVIDHARAKAARRERALDEETAKSVSPTEIASEVSDRQMDMEAALAELTDDQRELVTLKFIQGLSNPEVAETMGRSEDAIRVLQFRALKALREIMTKPAEGEGDDT